MIQIMVKNKVNNGIYSRVLVNDNIYLNQRFSRIEVPDRWS